jgi:hypothetical protein
MLRARPRGTGTTARTVVALLVALTAALAFVGVAPAGAATTPPTFLSTDTVAPGGSITVTGTGWTHPDGSGSLVAVKIDDVGAVIGPIQAAADGSFSYTISIPANLPQGQHWFRFLTGALKPGDTTRSVVSDPWTVSTAPSTTTTTAAPTTTTTAAPTTTTTAPTTTTTTNPNPNPGQASVSVVNSNVAPGGSVAITGTGWTHPGGGGSLIAVKIDDAGAVIGPIQAADDGSFSYTIDLPDDITPGAHWFRLLTGALKPGDTPRSIQAPFTVTDGETGGTSAEIAISTTIVDTGALTLSVVSDSVQLGTPSLSGGSLSATGALPSVTVIDLRSADPGWNVSGQASDFTSGANSIGASQLGWSPSVVSTSTGQVATPGASVAPGTGLASGRTLATADAGSGRGTAVLGAGLLLDIPTSAEPGTYTAKLTLTAI